MSKSTNGLRKAGLASLAVTLTLGAGFAGAGAAFADADFEFTRIDGENRFHTAALVADEYVTDTTDEVILVNGETGYYADALSANYLSGIRKAPILLTRDEFMPEYTKEALQNIDPSKVTIVGGDGVVPQDQADWLEAEGYTVERVAGDNRFLTNADVIETGGATTKDTGIVATGFDFADALGAGPAVYQGRPLGLSEQDDIHDDIVAALDASGVTKIVVMGGEAVVGQEVVDELKDAGFTVTRVDGEDRSETSTKFADYAIANFGFTNTAADVASGYTAGSGADALAGGPLTGERNRPMLITKNVDNPGALIGWLEAHAATLTEGVIYGGFGAVTASAEERMEAAARSVSSNQDYTVTPQEAKSLERVANPDTNAQDDRQYSVSGLDNSKTYTVALFLQDEVTTGSDSQTKFADADGNNVADRTAPAADITVVNGASQGEDKSLVRVSPVNGTITFTVDGDDKNETVVPVVWLDAANDSELDLVKPATANKDAKAPAEDFGVGGATTYTPSAATSGLLTTDKTIESVNKDANSITTADAIYTYDANDTYYVVTGEAANTPAEASVAPGQQVTMAEFEAQVSKNDQLDGFTFYQANAELPSRWVLEDLSPKAPSVPTASNITDTSVTLTVPSADVANAEKVTVYCAVDTNPATEADKPAVGDKDETTVTQKSTVCATATTDADSKTDGFQINVTGLKAGTTYDFAVSQTVDGEESAVSTELENVATKSGPVDKPTITDAVLTTDNVVEGIADKSDVWTLSFSEAMDTTKVAGSTIALTDVDGDTILVKCDATDAAGAGSTTTDNDTSAFCQPGDGTDTTVKNDTLKVTLTEKAIDRNAAGDQPFPGAIEYPLTITAVTGLTDADGDAATVDVANSADKVVDKEA